MQGEIEGVLSPIFRCKKASCTTKDEQTSLDFLWRRKKWFFLRLHLLPLMVVEKTGAISIDSADALNPIAPFNAIPCLPSRWLGDKMDVHFYIEDAISILQLQAFNQKSVYLHQNKFLIIF